MLRRSTTSSSLPSGRTTCGNARLGDIHPDDQLTVARTIRTRLIALPGRMVNLHGHYTLRLPTRWPWADTFNTALAQLRAIPQLA
ncbi:MAG: hypothetical protein ACLPVY_20385 [Acidimicrobiia bacterium]